MTGEAIVYAALLLFGAWLFLYDIKLMLWPQRRGRVAAVENQLEQAEKACDCGSMKVGKSYIHATVRMEDGEMEEVQLSPCLICMDKVTIGSQIGVNMVGDRLIARRYIDIFGRGLTNDDVPLPEPDEVAKYYIQGVAE
jgi:hypothetical protein